MNWESVNSSNLSRIAYDDRGRVLTVEFKNSARYAYYDVPRPIFEQLRSAPSKGGYLAENVKGRFRYARV